MLHQYSAEYYQYCSAIIIILHRALYGYIQGSYRCALDCLHSILIDGPTTNALQHMMCSNMHAFNIPRACLFCMQLICTTQHDILVLFLGDPSESAYFVETVWDIQWSTRNNPWMYADATTLCHRLWYFVALSKNNILWCVIYFQTICIMA